VTDAEAVAGFIEALRDRLARIIESERRDFDPPDGRWKAIQSPADEAARLRESRFPLPHAVPADRVPPRAWDLAERARLQDAELFILLLAAAASMDARLERAFDVLNAEAGSRTPTVATALRLAGLATADPAARDLVRPDGALVALGLVEIAESTRSILGRRVSAPDRVVDFLCGSDLPDLAVAPLVRPGAAPAEQGLPSIARVRRAIDESHFLVVVAPDGSAGSEHAYAALALTGPPPLVLDGRRVDDDGVPSVVNAIARESTLTGRGIVVTGVHGVDSWIRHAMARIAHLTAPIVLVGQEVPSSVRDHTITLTRPDDVARSTWWAEALDRHACADEVDAQEFSSTSSRLDPGDIAAIVEVAAQRAGSVPLTRRDLIEARLSAAVGSLAGNARLVSPAVTLTDLVLDPDTREQLVELRDRARLRSRVLSAAGVRVAATRGRGATAMFCGPSGSGKTFAAEAIAGELGIPLFVVDISQVIDKYIGETEKRLEQTLSAIERYDGVLLFDEGDAIFGSRSEVRDARDRYANIEVAYLLQRMESFEGLAIVTTNMRANVDPAFLRRFDLVLEFPDLNAEGRERLWMAGLADHLPLTPEEAAEFASVALTAGAIGSAIATAHYLAAAEAANLRSDHVRAAISREWRKFGRLPHGMAASPREVNAGATYARGG